MPETEHFCPFSHVNTGPKGPGHITRMGTEATIMFRGTPGLYDPLINRAFAELATHYRTLIDPARALKPRDKGRVERPVPYARDSFFAGRAAEFTSMEHMQAEAVRWNRDVANVRRCRPLDGVAPFDLFMAEEAHTLQALPRTAFELGVVDHGQGSP